MDDVNTSSTHGKVRSSERAFRDFMQGLNPIPVWDNAYPVGQPYLFAVKGEYSYLTVQDLFNREEQVQPPLIDIVRWKTSDHTALKTYAGLANWLGEYHLHDAREFVRRKIEPRPLHVVTVVPAWLHIVMRLKEPAVCFIGKDPELVNWRQDFVGCSEIICESEALGDLIYKGMRKRVPDVYPRVMVTPIDPALLIHKPPTPHMPARREAAGASA